MGVYLTNHEHVSWKSVTTTAQGAVQKCYHRVTLTHFTTSWVSKGSLKHQPAAGVVQPCLFQKERPFLLPGLKTSGQCSLGLNSLWFEALRDLVQPEQTGLSLRDTWQEDRSLLCPDREPAQCKLGVGSGCAALDSTVLRTGWASSGAALPVKPECRLAFLASASTEVLHGLEVARVGSPPSLRDTVCPPASPARSSAAGEDDKSKLETQSQHFLLSVSSWWPAAASSLSLLACLGAFARLTPAGLLLRRGADQQGQRVALSPPPRSPWQQKGLNIRVVKYLLRPNVSHPGIKRQPHSQCRSLLTREHHFLTPLFISCNFDVTYFKRIVYFIFFKITSF